MVTPACLPLSPALLPALATKTITFIPRVDGHTTWGWAGSAEAGHGTLLWG